MGVLRNYFFLLSGDYLSDFIFTIDEVEIAWIQHACTLKRLYYATKGWHHLWIWYIYQTRSPAGRNCVVDFKSSACSMGMFWRNLLCVLIRITHRPVSLKDIPTAYQGPVYVIDLITMWFSAVMISVYFPLLSYYIKHLIPNFSVAICFLFLRSNQNVL